MELAEALDWASERKHGVLITIRGDGRPQSSDILYAFDGDAFLISVTDDRAKTHNMRRDPRVVLHITDPTHWSYLSFDGTVKLSPPAFTPHDPTCDALVRYYELTAGKPHPDWAEYRKAMVAEKRLVATLTPIGVVGQIH
ncbi:MAG: PPOX class F420-dependent oxidoreductase [Acidimicrobiia bacterium]|nr:PPOX class F420-dependent oxidoreductase [Acidimicrobiia bacterium]